MLENAIAISPAAHTRIYEGGQRARPPPEISRFFINFYLLENVIVGIKS